ncbi:tRNA pseudouridine(38-40) synthase TruA [Mesonia maritima]|uniref:tRNA pseudouridine synthase A n=1 Tax=Mesonia maritima TaxID=1793873 RepID=A0ABU1K506_9FLAO|nr:tRNA pseudouridine(38-40) synthase TruA [Mesonia maritima]MDR6300697.1 tRNA pseudouridine38-40 synthase [Mesonia maritima]
MRLFLDLAYNGKAYHGWQIQPNAISVQEEVEKSLSVAFQQKISIVGAGRTDTGVHANQLIAHFDIDKEKINTSQLQFKLNSLLPNDIAIYGIYKVKPDAHARFDALSREYKYFVVTKKDPFLEDFAYYIKKELNIELMNEASKILLNYKDFKCFSKSRTDVKTYNCTIENASWKQKNHTLVFTIKADRFLRNMVRAIVGTLIEVGLEKIKPAAIHGIVKSRNRSNAGKSVDAKGLFLHKIEYPNEITQL